MRAAGLLLLGLLPTLILGAPRPVIYSTVIETITVQTTIVAGPATATSAPGPVNPPTVPWNSHRHHHGPPTHAPPASAPPASASSAASPPAASAPAASAPASSSAPPSTPGKLSLNLVNKLAASGGDVYAYFTATDVNGKLVMLTSSGQFYYPSTTSAAPEKIPDSANVAIKLTGSSTPITVPGYVAGARLWFSAGSPLTFSVTNTGGLVEPSSSSDSDPNHDTNWGFIEMTYSADAGLFANLSFVDMIGLPLGMKLTATGGANATQTAYGPHTNAVSEVCSNLKSQAAKDGHPWGQLCKNDSKGNLIRVVSPQTLLGQDTSAFTNYFEPYVETVYAQFASQPLTIQTQAGFGDVKCTASGDTLNCAGDDSGFGKPSTADILGCNSGPFANTGNDVHLAVLPRLCAAFNRATLHLPGGSLQPSLPPSHYYKPPANNWYSAFIHEAELDGKGYAFSYDDVTPNEEYNTAGAVASAQPEVLEVYIGGYSGKSGA